MANALYCRIPRAPIDCWCQAPVCITQPRSPILGLAAMIKGERKVGDRGRGERGAETEGGGEDGTAQRGRVKHGQRHRRLALDREVQASDREVHG